MGDMATRAAEDGSVKLERAAKLLHDEIGPLMSAAGLRLQLIKMDFPETAPLVLQVTEILDEAIDRVRDMSRELRSHEPLQAKPPAPSRKLRQVKTSAPQKK
jgi:signal transduction histidine kinase